MPRRRKTTTETGRATLAANIDREAEILLGVIQRLTKPATLVQDGPNLSGQSRLKMIVAAIQQHSQDLATIATEINLGRVKVLTPESEPAPELPFASVEAH